MDVSDARTRMKVKCCRGGPGLISFLHATGAGGQARYVHDDCPVAGRCGGYGDGRGLGSGGSCCEFRPRPVRRARAIRDGCRPAPAAIHGHSPPPGADAAGSARERGRPGERLMMSACTSPRSNTCVQRSSLPPAVQLVSPTSSRCFRWLNCTKNEKADLSVSLPLTHRAASIFSGDGGGDASKQDLTM
jgi:hypothetical protein